MVKLYDTDSGGGICFDFFQFMFRLQFNVNCRLIVLM